jgi:hypothetical protein
VILSNGNYFSLPDCVRYVISHTTLPSWSCASLGTHSAVCVITVWEDWYHTRFCHQKPFASMTHFWPNKCNLLSAQYIYLRQAMWPLHLRATSTYLVDWSQYLKASSNSCRSSALHRWWPHRRILRRSATGALHLRHGCLPEGKSCWIFTGSMCYIHLDVSYLMDRSCILD